MTRRTVLSLFALWLMSYFFRIRTYAVSEVILAKEYREEMEVEGLWLSEKLDGIRAVWDGEKLTSRRGTSIHAPKWFLETLPPFAVEGELWVGRGAFERVASIVLDHTPGKEWQHVEFHIFEVPDESLRFQERLAKVQTWLKAHPHTHLHSIPQIPCESKAHFQQFTEEVQSYGGEGVVLRDPQSRYEKGRSDSYLKFKTVSDSEGTVVGYREGKGKYSGQVGALKLQLDDGTLLYIGSGLSDAMRANPPEVGTVVTFKYRGYTRNGKPRFASFWRIRKD